MISWFAQLGTPRRFYDLLADVAVDDRGSDVGELRTLGELVQDKLFEVVLVVVL
jgi:hypothetical protein